MSGHRRKVTLKAALSELILYFGGVLNSMLYKLGDLRMGQHVFRKVKLRNE